MIKIAIIVVVTVTIVAALRSWRRSTPEPSVAIRVVQWLVPVVALILIGLTTVLLLLGTSEGIHGKYQTYASAIVQKAFTESYPEEFKGGKFFLMAYCTSEQLQEWEQGRYPLCSIAKGSFDSCAFWWIPRRCGAIQTTPDIYGNERIRGLFELAARQPCRVIKKPEGEIFWRYAWHAARCDVASIRQQYDVAIDVEGPDRQGPRTRVATISRPWWWAKDVWDEFTHW